MKISPIWILWSLIPTISAFAAEPVTKQLSLAAFDVEATAVALKERATQFSALFQVGLSAQTGIVMVERAQLDAALGELSLGSSGLVDPASAAKVGRLTGAKVLVFSKAIGSPAEMTVVAKVMCLNPDGKDDKLKESVLGSLRNKPDWTPPLRP